ncbi:OadG family protein [Acetanaerobacterium elongatum]|uniref:OadG family protein n=1 Tax=Acetanaerobacterium elongatum TaxID=258515 RepID=UPI000B85EDD4
MSFGQAVIVALFCMAVVFLALIVLSVILSLFSALIQFMEKKKNNAAPVSNSKT